MCTACMLDRVLDHLELKLQTAVVCHMHAGNRTHMPLPGKEVPLNVEPLL